MKGPTFDSPQPPQMLERILALHLPETSEGQSPALPAQGEGATFQTYSRASSFCFIELGKQDDVRDVQCI